LDNNAIKQSKSTIMKGTRNVLHVKEEEGIPF